MQAPQRKTFTGINVAVISQPRRPSNTALSAFQVSVRSSNDELPPPAVVVDNNKPLLIAVVALLLGVIGVLVFLLFL